MWIVSKNIHIDGYDIDPAYVAECKDVIREQNLTNYVNAKLQNVYDAEITTEGYDYVVFSSTYAVIPDVADMVKHCTKFCNKNGHVIIMTTLFDYFNPLMQILKPKLKYFLAPDFGRFVTRSMIRTELEEKGLEIGKFERIHTTWFGTNTYLLTVKPKGK